MSPWAAQCLCVKKDGTLRLCIDWRELNNLLLSDSGGLCDMQMIFDGLKSNKYFTQLDVASGFHHMEIAEKDRYKTAFRDADGMLWEFTRAGFGLTMLPAAFTRRAKSALGHLSGVFSWLDVLIASDTWEEHLATLTLVLNRLLAAGLPVNFAKCIFGATSQAFLGMIMDSTGLYPVHGQARCNLTHASAAHTAEDDAFQSFRETLASPTVLAFPDLERPFELHTDASTLGVGASLTQTIDGATRAVAFASHRFWQTDARRGPTEREGMGVLWAVDHFRPCLACRRFKLVTDCSALTWLFRSRELCPKLHRWALRLMEYDMELEWKAGVEHVVPDALSWLPVTCPVEVDADDSFPDDLSSTAAGASVEIVGPDLDGVRLAELDPVQVDRGGDADSQPSHPTPEMTNFHLSALRALPFAACAAVDPERDAARRSGRTRTPSVRLPPIDDAQLLLTSVLEAIPDREAIGPTTVESFAPAPSPSTLPPSPGRPGHDDIGEVLAARGEVPASSSSQTIGRASAIDLTARILTKPSELAHRQQDDTHLGQVRKVLSNGVDLARGEVGATGIGTTLSLLRDHFHWPTMTNDTRHYVLSCTCRRRKRPLSRRETMMMPGRPLEPWDELQMDILKIDTPSQTGNNYILLVVDRASKFPFGFPLEIKQAVGVARVVVELCLT
ncbi:unnamed protein product [Ectocarpus sp. CCAP 1310/34]|nr:unnamed protein product [Ectocarpus sp. CCAP 1310/34]